MRSYLLSGKKDFLRGGVGAKVPLDRRGAKIRIPSDFGGKGELTTAAAEMHSQGGGERQDSPRMSHPHGRLGCQVPRRGRIVVQSALYAAKAGVWRDWDLRYSLTTGDSTNHQQHPEA
jgi:hypothetical protein